MITDDDLRSFVATLAATAPEPSPFDRSLLAAEPPRPRRQRRWQRQRQRAIGPMLGSVAIIVLVVVCVAWFVNLAGSRGESKSATVANSTGGEVVGTAGAGGAAARGGATGGSPPLARIPPIADTAKVVKNGAIELGVSKGGVTDAVARLTSITSGFGGYVADSKTSASSEISAQSSASVTVRVPAASFEQLVNEASKLGVVRSTTTSGQDVTAQFTDIDAQITALRATRDQLLVVLAQANNVGDILAVQDRITQVQVQVDQLEGQKRLLTDQTSFGTLTVTMLEPGATAAASARPASDDDGFGGAWRTAVDQFVHGLEWVVSASGVLALLAIAATAAYVVHRTVRRRLLTL